MNTSDQHHPHTETLGLAMSEVSRILGISTGRIRRICREGRLGRRVEVGSISLWAITKEDVDKFQKIPRHPGRPKKIA